MIAFLREMSAEAACAEPVRPARRTAKFDRVSKQHEAYVGVLRELGLVVEFITGSANQANSVFVEDTAILLPEVAIIARPEDAAKAAEIEIVAPILAQYGPVQRLADQGLLAGRDVLRIGRVLYIGLTEGTNETGIAGVREIVEPFGYEVRAIETRDCPHLKAACSFLPPQSLLVNPAWVSPVAFGNLKAVPVPEAEPLAANTLSVAGTTLVSAAYPETQKRLKETGMSVRSLDISEFERLGGDITSLSLILEPRLAKPPAREMDVRPLQVPAVPAPAGHASQAVVHGGLVHVSLLLPFEPGLAASGRIPVEKQTELALQNLGTVLVAAGSSLTRVLRVTLHLADVKHLERVEPVYAQLFDGHRPARSVVENGALAPGVLVAVEAIAAAGG